ncbi:DUF4303 domain-containing protein [Kroppenstedtia eburnea]|nr:DUF4303 domain-containing protein [Kroppenstedtia eburnea]
MYVFALDCDDDGGSVVMLINTESEFLKTADKFPQYSYMYGERGLYGPCGYKYDVSSFKFRKHLFFEEYYNLMIECDVPADKQVFYRKQFNKLIVNVIQKIKPFNLLKKTETFVSYYTLHDVDCISTISLMRKTITDQEFKRTFRI